MFFSNRSVVPNLGKEYTSCYLCHCVIPLLVAVQYRDDINYNLTDDNLHFLSQKTIEVLQGEGSISNKYYFTELYCFLFEHYPSVKSSSDTMSVFQAMEGYYSHPSFSGIIDYLLTLRVVSKDTMLVSTLNELVSFLFAHCAATNTCNYRLSYCRLCILFFLFSI